MGKPFPSSAALAARRLNDDIADLARDSTALKRENAELRRQLATAEEALAISREAHAVMMLQIALLERLAREIKRAAEKQPHWPLARWVKFGPMAAFLATIKDPS
ncbi:hypothetical protein K2O51_23160 [Cupriavidus pinatubonensis]|uniref:hypothetical protein n=1 Tax=Cupriavidus pinatubonensis TaxID=248026 RepID=UPI001C73186C|nr:hypothetical protein [Cupriavidus pinatubonensis]QYY30273.1 hypothetical protein K2O51_23160 [Cupriavidus pinatubonensis]